jgi:hypothetical protein
MQLACDVATSKQGTPRCRVERRDSGTKQPCIDFQVAFRLWPGVLGQGGIVGLLVQPALSEYSKPGRHVQLRPAVLLTKPAVAGRSVQLTLPMGSFTVQGHQAQALISGNQSI